MNGLKTKRVYLNKKSVYKMGNLESENKKQFNLE
jgi:hypothetical protein